MTDGIEDPKVFSKENNSQVPRGNPNGAAEFAFPPGVVLENGGRSRLLRRLRVEVQELRNVINLVQAGTTTLQGQAFYLKKTKEDLAAIRQVLVDLVASGTQETKEIEEGEDPEVTDDTIDRLINILEQMDHSPLLAERSDELPGQEQINATAILMAQVQQVELLVGLLTIPKRLNDWLANSKPGFYVPFHLVFKDEIPNEADRQTVVNFLAWSPKLVTNGIVDVTNGLVFRYDEDPNKRQRSIAFLVGGILLSLLIVVSAAYLPLPGWPAEAAPQRAAGFTIAWLAVLIGVIAHIGVEGVKREQETKLPTLLTVSSIGETIDARIGQIFWKLLLVLIGLFALVFAIDANSISPVNGFLVGYSLDSIVGVFGTNVESKVKAVQSQLTPK